MQFLNCSLGRLCVLTLVVGVTATAAVQSANAAPPVPDHGVNNSTHYTLWSGDEDETRSETPDWSNTSTSPMQELARRTDVPFDSPPDAVEQWNRDDLHDLGETDASASIHPPNATLTDGAILKDAYVEVFAI